MKRREEVLLTAVHRESNYKRRGWKRADVSRAILISIILALLWTSCKDSVTEPGVSNVVFPDSLVSYSQHVDALFQQSCVPGCHDARMNDGNLNLERPSWSNLINHQPQLVIPRQASNCLLVERLDGRIPPPMPPFQPLNTNQLNGIKKWINEGALNN